MEIEGIVNWGRELDYFAMHDQITIDFGEVRFFSPFGMLFFASKIKSFCESNAGTTVQFKNVVQHTYLAHMGFFKCMGIDYGREVGEIEGSNTCIPITKISRAELFVNPKDKYSEIQDLIQKKAEHLSSVLVHQKENHETMFDALSYSLRELFRNVFEHSKSESLYFCAQYWPTSQRVEAAVVDFGRGVRKSLAENPNFRFQTSKEALEYSLLPSVSGTTHLPRRSNTWFNSGYGLYMINRLARNGGNFVILSGDSAIHMSRKTKYNYSTSFHGTAIRISLDVKSIGSVKARLDEFRKDGQELAANISGTAKRPPSAMSLLLRRDYE